MDEYVGKEREAGRLLGLFSIKDCPEVHISPFGVIPRTFPHQGEVV